jgi:hypothetical protein
MALLLATFALLAITLPAPAAEAAVTVSRAELSGTSLRLEGTATAGRDITVDRVVMGRSDSGGRFRIDRTGYTRPADCTIDVNDGSATPRTATLRGCTVTSPPPPLATGPAAPAPIAPGAGASVASPVGLSWSAVSDPSGIAGYNWEVATSSTFATKVAQDSTSGTVTQATVGGLAPGTYFWRVQAASNAFVQGAWSAVRSFTVTATAPGSLGAPVLATLPEGAQYHPMESFSFSWSGVTGAASYVVEASRDAAFPAPVDIKTDNVTETRSGLTFHSSLIGSWNLRVRAVGTDGVLGPPSNVRTFTVSYNAPVGPAPTLASPATGASLSLPITLDWNDVTNPQPSGYEVQVATDSGFSNVEVHAPQLTSSQYTLLSLTPGTKFWRVRHHEGDASATTAAVTPWSAARSFTVGGSSSVATVSFTRPSAFSGEEIVGEVQLGAAAPAGGATVQLSSTHPSATALPASVSIPAGQAFAQFRVVRLGQVTTATDATVTASFGGGQATTTLRIDPPSLKEILPINGTITGGTSASPMLALNGAAPSGGAEVSLSSSSALARPPASVTVPAGSFFHSVSIPTSAVQTQTTVTITATWQGRSVSYPLTLTPEVAPAEFTLESTSTTGSQGTAGFVGIAEPQTRDVTFDVTSSHPDIARSAPVTVPAGVTRGRVLVITTNPSAPTDVTLSVSAGGVTRSVTLTVNPIATAPPPSTTTLAAPSLLSPATGARVRSGRSVTFDWSDVSGASGYQLQVSSTSTFGSTVLDRAVTTSRVSASLTGTGDRFWRARATGPGGAAGPWSAVRSLRVSR